MKIPPNPFILSYVFNQTSYEPTLHSLVEVLTINKESLLRILHARKVSLYYIHSVVLFFCHSVPSSKISASFQIASRISNILRS